jgi:UDP:flavonoid glycosyltransferase YjiC (YdhE family)
VVGWLQVPRILTVGPTLLESVKRQPDSSHHECIEWLNSKSVSSVLYIAFGSVAKLPSAVITELAFGLEASGQSFLWALRAPDVASILPDGFMERNEERGLVFSGWAPQLEILAHPAVGGFLSHIGWNSAMESLCMGVPMVTWPLQAEQYMNRTLFVDVLEVAVGVRKGADGVERDKVERAIRLLLQDEKGHTLRRNVKAVGATLHAAMVPGGSSFQNLHSFVQELRSMNRA